MSPASESLWQVYRKKTEIPAALALSAILLLFGLFMPVITLKELVFFKSTFSVVSGIASMIHEGHIILALIIFLFSIVFPISKLIVLSIVWFSRMEEKSRDIFLHWLGILGKWSMLDVFVVAVTIVITKISKLAKAEPRIGIYLFGLSVIIAMLVTERIERLIKRRKEIKNENISFIDDRISDSIPTQDRRPNLN